jgi:hypothetical protein
MGDAISTYTVVKLTADLLSKFVQTPSGSRGRPSVDSPPGKIEDRVFVGGNYVLMPILRLIEDVVREKGFQPIIPYDFDIPREKTREYTLRLLYQCRLAIFEETLGDGHMVEVARTSGFGEIGILQIYMAMNESKEPPKTMSIMVWQSKPPPEGYLTINELREIVEAFLARHA